MLGKRNIRNSQNSILFPQKTKGETTIKDLRKRKKNKC